MYHQAINKNSRRVATPAGAASFISRRLSELFCAHSTWRTKLGKFPVKYHHLGEIVEIIRENIRTGTSHGSVNVVIEASTLQSTPTGITGARRNSGKINEKREKKRWQ